MLVTFFQKNLCLVLKIIYSFFLLCFFSVKKYRFYLLLFPKFLFAVHFIRYNAPEILLALTFNIYFCCYFWHLFTLLTKFNKCFPPNFLARNAFRPFIVSFMFSWWAIIFIVCINCNKDISSSRDVFFKKDETKMPKFFCSPEKNISVV